MSTFANSEDPDCCISLTGSTLFVKVKKIIVKIIKRTPLDMCNGLSLVYCIKPEGRIH